MSGLIKETTRQFVSGHDLEGASAERLLDEMITATEDEPLVGLFRAWDRKGIAADEIYWIAKLLRERCIKVNSRHKILVDIVGTGGSSAKTFNVSTAAAFVVAGAGVPVAKHGNRAATSNSGSADVLTELDIKPDITPDVAENCLNDIGICFMFAPNHHRLSATLGRVRRDLGFPTIFNCVGPLANPANVPHQVIGVWNNGMVEKIAHALSRLGTKRSWIVNGHDKLDEISLTGQTVVSDVLSNSFATSTVTADQLGIDKFSGDLPTGCSPQESAEIIRAVLGNKMKERDVEKLVLLNAAAAIHVAGVQDSLKDAYHIATESIRSGSAARKIKELERATK